MSAPGSTAAAGNHQRAGSGPADAKSIRQRLMSTAHSRLPVGEGSVDKLIGVVIARELLAVLLSDKPLDVKAHVRKAPIVPDTTDALETLELLRDAEVPVALVHDEYGDFEGLVTPADILEAITGVFRSDAEGEEQAATPRDDGSWLLAGWMPVDEMADQLGSPCRQSATTKRWRASSWRIWDGCPVPAST